MVIGWSGAIQLMQMQEDLRKRLEAGDGETGEEAIESYLESKQKMMLDSLWKLNVADIELTLSHVCQQVCVFIQNCASTMILLIVHGSFGFNLYTLVQMYCNFTSI